MQLHNLVAALSAGAANVSLGHNASLGNEVQGLLLGQCSSRATLSSLAELVATGHFVADAEPCQVEAAQFLLLFFGLAGALAAVVFALANVREDKVENIPPLCPGLVVRESVLHFRMPLDTPNEELDKFEVHDSQGRVLCKVTMHWADPFLRQENQSMVATATIQDSYGCTLATVVARNTNAGLYSTPSLTIRRAFKDTFAKVDVEGPRMMNITHWMNMHMLTLIGEFGPATDVEGINAEGTKVFSMRRMGDECVGKVLCQVDAGLVISSLLAARIHRRLTSPHEFPLLPGMRSGAHPEATTGGPQDASEQEDEEEDPSAAKDSVVEEERIAEADELDAAAEAIPESKSEAAPFAEEEPFPESRSQAAPFAEEEESEEANTEPLPTLRSESSA